MIRKLTGGGLLAKLGCTDTNGGRYEETADATNRGLVEHSEWRRDGLESAQEKSA